MRNIKFRGKGKDNVWVYGSHVVDANSNHYILSPLSDKSGDKFWNSKFQNNEIIPETVSQLTGLTDKCGKEIYEGDIMGRLFDDYNENTIILYHKGVLCAKPISKNRFRPLNTFIDCGWVRVDKGNNYNFEIIGNIHDNYELLNKE